MAQINIRIDDDSRDAVDSLARAKGVSTSDLLRELIGQALGKDDDRPRADTTPQSLSVYQRRQLALHHEVLGNLITEPEWEVKYHRQMVEVLNAGYTSEYYKTFQMIQPELTARESTLVFDILEMFTTVERSVSRLNEKQRASLGEHADYALKFKGFDFNNSHEGKLSSFAEYLVRDGRWTNLADRFSDENERGNSHSPMLAAYQRMLSAWRPLWDKKLHSYGGPNDYQFTVEELQQIVAAWPYSKD